MSRIDFSFPRGIGTNIISGQPYMLLTSYESKNAIESVGQAGHSGGNPGIAKSSIALYIPPNALKTAFTATYDSTPGAATKAAMGAAWTKETGALDIIWAGLKGAGISLGEAAAKQTDKGTGMLAAQGIAVNNHMALAYKGPGQFRTHDFAFNFFAKNAPDAEVIRKILEDLENGMLPRLMGPPVKKNRTVSSPFFQAPRHWTIDFFRGDGKPNKFLHTIKKSVIKSMQVNHDPNSTISFHEDGSPVQTSLTLTFQEIELPFSGDKAMDISKEIEFANSQSVNP